LRENGQKRGFLTKGGPRKDKTFPEVVREFDEYVHDPDQFHKIFSELGFSYVDDGCDGDCDACKKATTCEVYAEITSKDDSAD
jgi:hypothetical protein